jgi:hypothetical protein
MIWFTVLTSPMRSRTSRAKRHAGQGELPPRNPCDSLPHPVRGAAGGHSLHRFSAARGGEREHRPVPVRVASRTAVRPRAYGWRPIWVVWAGALMSRQPPEVVSHHFRAVHAYCPLVSLHSACWRHRWSITGMPLCPVAGRTPGMRSDLRETWAVKVAGGKPHPRSAPRELTSLAPPFRAGSDRVQPAGEPVSPAGVTPFGTSCICYRRETR